MKKVQCKIGDEKVQSLYRELNGTISADRLGVVLDEIEKLPQLNKSGIKIRNKKDVMIAFVGTKGSLKKFTVDYCNGCWYFDGNRLGKKKRLLIDTFYDSVFLENCNFSDGEIDKIWKKISHRAESL